MASANSPFSSFGPFGNRAFTVIWAATVVSNIGSWMYSAASAWLMTELDADPMMVSLVQVASSLPIFFFALPAGAIADIVDKRMFLLLTEIATTAAALVFAWLVALDAVTPLSLLAFTFILGVGSALTAPAYQSIVPLLVAREDLAHAIAINSVGVNVSRAVGPALGGAVTAVAGIAAPFWINAVSNLASVGALAWWRSPEKRERQLPAERFVGAMRTGIRYARHNQALRATLVRAVAFFLFASAYWALLPLVARDRIAGGGANLYGILLGLIGAGAIAGAFLLARLRAMLGADGMVAAGTVATALAIALYGIATHPAIAVAASLLAGVSWIAVLSSLNVSAQVALPEWVRSRGLAVYVTVFFGALTAGSALWGRVARLVGVAEAHYIAAFGAILAIPLTWRWKLLKGVGVDLTPSAHWPPPVLSHEVDDDAGPVMVTVEYRIDPKDRDAFLAAVHRQAAERRRDGAYRWAIYEDVSDPSLFIEAFHVESWLEHLRQHDRVTRADRDVEKRVRQFVIGEPRIRHMLAATLSG